MSIRNDLEDAFNEGYAKGLKEGRRFAEPVVRCKECRYCDNTQWCEWVTRYITSDGSVRTERGEKMADRLISADALLKEAMEDGAYGYVDAEQIANAPTIDAVEVVRCKDCKRSYRAVWKTDDKHLFCKMTNHLMWVDDFCSWGERREDEQPK